MKKIYSKEQLKQLKIDSIVFYCIEGDYRVDKIIEGGGVSLPGAVIGGIIAGGVGEVLAGRKKIKTIEKELDERKNMSISNGGDSVFLVSHS